MNASWDGASQDLFAFLLRKVNWVITALTAGFILYTRSSGVVYFTSGAVLCSLTAKLLKRVVRQPRPLSRPEKKKASYGMPSTHSATISFYATYVTLACAYLPLHPSLPNNPMIRVIPPVVSPICAYFVASSRVWLGKHSWPQIAVGCLYGTVFAIYWFKLWTRGLNEYGRVADGLLEQYIGI
ncbi:hypothetical protein JAAARDRAFT_53549 [Jaapia argillacea MUCL 33604]|uniref:Phosphatidic acid phosphatase type 2/haloperoxidase domain-containing protein n=1 Tax=Jaapia argillacea MUCL 33604 TaxID=933084 RepID=A0A067QAZ8_9AGAM|nr:hypothetical protein JAAARDRAFT_53549 [Jaapia argillacea MUCL 33604]